MKSQIDQISINGTLLESSQEWTINPTGIPNADHWMASAKLSNSDIPKTGKGRWSISPKIFKDAAFKKTVQSIEKEVICKLNEYMPKQRTDQNSPQTIYFDFKTKIMEGA